jgi:mRNA-degrading endonuclease RelE of RelBE toxin-antitoxin system
MAWQVELSEEAYADLADLRAFDHRRVLDAIRFQLTAAPDAESRSCKCLGDGLSASFVYVPPLWELKVGEFRVFYELEANESIVYVHAVRRKPPHMTTAQVLRGDE